MAEVRARRPLWLPNPQSLLHEAVLGRSHREHGILRAAALPGRYHDPLQVQQEQTGCLGAGKNRPAALVQGKHVKGVSLSVISYLASQGKYQVDKNQHYDHYF